MNQHAVEHLSSFTGLFCVIFPLCAEPITGAFHLWPNKGSTKRSEEWCFSSEEAFRVCTSVSAWARPSRSRVAYLGGLVQSGSVRTRRSSGRADSAPPANIAHIIFTLRRAEINPQQFAETSQPGFRKCSDDTTTDIKWWKIAREIAPVCVSLYCMFWSRCNQGGLGVLNRHIIPSLGIIVTSASLTQLRSDVARTLYSFLGMFSSGQKWNVW